MKKLLEVTGSNYLEETTGRIIKELRNWCGGGVIWQHVKRAKWANESQRAKLRGVNVKMGESQKRESKKAKRPLCVRLKGHVN